MKRIFTWLVLFPMVLTALSPAVLAADDGVVTLRWFMRWDQVRIEKVAIPVKEAFEKSHPNIRIEIENNGGSSGDYWEKLQTMVIGGTVPDILYPATHYGFSLAVQDQLLDLRPYVERDGIDLDQYLYDIDELYTYNEELWALPIDWARLAVFYNEDMFAKAGLATPPNDWTWDEFMTFARRLTKDVDGDGSFDTFAVRDFSSYWPIMAWSFSGHGLYNDLRRPTETLINSPGVVDGIQFLRDMIYESNVIPTERNLDDWRNVFPGGVAGMEVVGHWRIPTYKETLGFDWNLAPLPRARASVNRVDGSGFAIAKGTDHPDEAWEFVKFLAAPDGLGVRLLLELQQFTPVTRSLIESEAFLSPPNMDVNKRAFLAGDLLMPMYEPIGPMYDTLNELVDEELDRVWDGEQSPAQAAKKLEDVLTSKLAELNERFDY